MVKVLTQEKIDSEKKLEASLQKHQEALKDMDSALAA